MASDFHEKLEFLKLMQTGTNNLLNSPLREISKEEEAVLLAILETIELDESFIKDFQIGFEQGIDVMFANWGIKPTKRLKESLIKKLTLLLFEENHKKAIFKCLNCK